MNSFRKYILVFIWFILRPKYYRHLAFLIKLKFIPNRNFKEMDLLVARWCEKKAISSQEAIFRITGKYPAYSVKSLYKGVFRVASKKVASYPVRFGGGADLDLLYYLAEHFKVTNVIETGVAYGWSSLALLLSMLKRPGSKLISTDFPYQQFGSEKYIGCVVPHYLRHLWQLILRPDRESIPILLGKFSSIDMCHYDSDKSYSGRIWAYQRIWSSLRNGGVFISDDISDNFAFRDFFQSKCYTLIIVRFSSKYIGIVIK
jgi:hypothetical protein